MILAKPIPLLQLPFIWSSTSLRFGFSSDTSLRYIESLIVRLAKETLRWGYFRLEGELKKPGFLASLTTVRNVLDRNGIVPAPVRYGSIGWKTMMKHYKDQLLACDFFTVETIFLKTVYVLIFIELGTRRVHLAGITTNPDGLWVAQQARQLMWQFDQTDTSFRCLIRDNDKKYTHAFDTVFESQDIRYSHRAHTELVICQCLPRDFHQVVISRQFNPGFY